MERARILDGSDVRPGDTLIGLPSSGLHTNGYSLARRILFEGSGLSVDDPIPGLGATVKEALLAIHRSYWGVLRAEIAAGRLVALAHITGGGMPGNIPRSLPGGLGAEIRRDSWEIPRLFHTLQALGSVSDEEMFRVFNMGVGMVVITRPAEAAGLLARLRTGGEAAWELGVVCEGEGVRLVLEPTSFAAPCELHSSHSGRPSPGSERRRSRSSGYRPNARRERAHSWPDCAATPPSPSKRFTAASDSS